MYLNEYFSIVQYQQQSSFSVQLIEKNNMYSIKNTHGGNHEMNILLIIFSLE